MENSGKYVIWAAYAGILAAVTDLVSTVGFGFLYPGYSWINDTVSKLGATASPVSTQISILWIVIGILLILFGLGFRKAFSGKGHYAILVSWLIVLYGLGEGIGSGVFKADRLANALTTSGFIHEIFGSVGVVAILLFPFAMLKIIPESENRKMYILAKFAFSGGIIFILLFLSRYTTDSTNFVSVYKGLWQRLFILISYIYLISIAVFIITQNRSHNPEK